MTKLFKWMLAVGLVAGPLAAADLEVGFMDEAWNGMKVPEGQQCQKFGGHGRSPELRVSNIPEAADLLVIEFSDRTYTPMDQGGHGKIGFGIEAGAGAVDIPSVDGHTVDLPAGFLVVSEHKAPSWDKAGAYLPPCSGGQGNEYYLTVRAVHQMGDEKHELASATLEMGTY